ncbi:MAG: response regulator [Candidatus Eremiobacteraeota bacterium]|nr:response regulator [Candidatus Eremiobacteraeota bacterium]
MKILTVDDNRPSLELMTYLLRAFGHDVTPFNSSGSALEAAISGDYDLIVADVRMPDMDGFEFIRRYKREAASPAPVIAVTAHAMVGDKERMLAAGFDGYIPKPIDPQSIKAEIDEMLTELSHNGASVLIVDNTTVNLELLDRTLTPFGYRVVRARSVREAESKLETERPSLILCDLHMPGGDAFELLQHVKADSRLQDIPVLVMSSSVWQTADKQRALELGAKKFILRPIEPQALVNEVRDAIGG